MNREVEGIILTETAYGESSKIVNILTKECGIIGVMAKGAKKVNSKLRYCTDKFTIGKFSIIYKENKLSLLTGGDILFNINNIKTDIIKIGYLTYISELAYQTSTQSNDSNIYTLLISTIKKMEEGLDPAVLTNIFEVKMLPYLGVGLNLDECVICGNKDVLTIDADKGGYICKNCHTNEIIYSSKTIKMIRLYYYVDVNSISELKISEEVKKELNNLLHEYYDRYTGLYLKSKKFLESIEYL